MSRITERFELLKQRGERALICYIMAGDPDMATTVDIALALDKAGVDCVELGVPFSDPLADGPSIQAAGFRAVQAGGTTRGVLETVKKIRAQSHMPLVIMTYYNPTLAFGVERFAHEFARAGADGCIQTDLTPEEANPWLAAARSAGLDTVFLLAPTSTPERMDVVAKVATGFVYCVSRTGVTGAKADVTTELEEFVNSVRERVNLPACVGFGISQPAQVAAVTRFAEGAVVGTAIVDIIAGAIPGEEAMAAGAFAASLKAATLASGPGDTP